MARATCSRGKVLDRERETLPDHDQDMVEIKKYASHPAHPEDKKCMAESRRRMSNIHVFSFGNRVEKTRIGYSCMLPRQ